MADKEMILLITILVLQVAHVESAAYSGCFAENIRSRHFKMSPGNYQPSTLTVEVCMELCGQWGNDYAGLTSKMFCFCATTEPDAGSLATEGDCNLPCEGDPAQMCGGAMHVSVYSSSQPINKVELSASPLVVKTAEAVTFTIVTAAGGALNYGMNYGDGSGDMDKNLTQMLTKSYLFPGQFDAVVTAVDVAQSVVPKTGSAGVMVEAPVKGLYVECPLFITDEEEFCVATITEGSRIQLTDEIDGTINTIDVADPVTDAAGCCVHDTPDAQTIQGNDGTYMMHDAEFRFQGVVTYWELWADASSFTALTVKILKPTCTDYCYETRACGGCAVACVSPDIFCPRAMSCSGGCTDTDRSTAPTVSYDVREAVTLTVANGYQVIPASPYVEVFPGDILAFESTATSAGVAYVDNRNVSDYQYAVGAASFAAGGGAEQPGKRHQLRAIYSSQTKVHLTYYFTEPGIFPLKTTVSNLGLPFSEVNMTEIEILQGINVTIIDNEMYWATNEEGTLQILPQTGTGVKWNWELGDGTVDNDTTSMTYLHTYTAKGTYLVTATAWNALTSKSNTTTVVVQDRVTGFSIAPINCITLTNCAFVVSMAAGSDYVIEWDYGDGNTETTLEADIGDGDTHNHIYNSGGNFTVNITISNNISSTFHLMNVLVQEQCVGLAMVRYGAEKNESFRLEWTLDQGTDCVFVLTFDGNALTYEPHPVDANKWWSEELPGQLANAYPFVLNVSNAISSDSLSDNFIIETAMRDVVSSCDLSETGTGVPVTCTVTMTEGSNVGCAWDWDDGDVDTLAATPADWAGRPDLNEARTHTFNTGKVHNVTITCANNDNSEIMHHEILVIVSVNNVELVHQPTIFFTPAGIGIFSFTNTGPAPNEAVVTFNFGDGFDFTGDLEIDKNYTHMYRDTTDPGSCYAIEAAVSNPVSIKTFIGTEMCVIDPVIDMIVVTDPPGAIKGVGVTAKISMYRAPSGSFAVLACDFQDGLGVQTWDRVGSGEDGEDTRVITYNNLGFFTISCTVTTPLETQTATYGLNVDEPVTDDCEITTNFPVELDVTDPVQYFVVCNAAPLPTNAVIVVDPGDGSTPIEVNYDNSPGKEGVPQQVDYLPAEGHYTATITLKNDGSNISESLLAGRYVRLTTTTMNCQYKPAVPVNGPLLVGLNGVANSFPTSTPITCSVDVAAGTPVEYVFTATHSSGDPIIVCNKTESPFSCLIPEPGEYAVSATVYNPLGASTPFTGTITMHEGVNEVRVTEVTPNADPNTEKTFQLDFDTLGENSCLHVDFGDSTGRTFNYGDPATCNDEFDGGVYSGVMANPMNITYVYQDIGNYILNITILNSFSETHLTFAHSVSSLNCSKPTIQIEDASMDFTNPLRFEKSKKVIIRGKSNISCAATLKNFKTWVVQKIDPEYGTPESTSSITSDKAELIVARRKFDYGLYKATYTIEMDMSDGTVFKESAYTFFEIIKSSLILLVEIGGISEVDRGENSVVTFSPADYSLDPDVDPLLPQDFDTFTWGCEMLEGLSSPTACDAIEGSTNPILTFNANTFALGERIELSCTGTKDDRSSTGKIIVNLVTGEPLEIYIEPTGSTYTHQVSDGRKISSTDRLALAVRCKNCDPLALTCSWTVFSYDYRWPWRDYFVSEVTPHLSDMVSPKIAVMPTLYNIHPTVMKYRLAVKCSQPGGDEGRAALNVYLNRPPSGGTCTVSPLVSTLGWGSDMGNFNVRCNGWTDAEGVAVYKFFCKHLNNMILKQIQTYRDASNQDIDPPLGPVYYDYKQDLYVDISDYEGATARVFISEIQAKPPTDEQIREWTTQENFLSMTDLKKRAASGEQKEVTELMTSTATLLNYASMMHQIESQGLEGLAPALGGSVSFLMPSDTTVADALDAATQAANQHDADLLLQYELETDRSALLRTEIAVTCANMTTANSAAAEQVLTCLGTVASRPNECTGECQQASLDKAEELVDFLEDLEASAEQVKSLLISIFDVAQKAITAGEVNKEHPTLTDETVAQTSELYFIYDTDEESKAEGFKDEADPERAHTKNIHKTGCEQKAEGNTGKVDNIFKKGMNILAQALTPGEQVEVVSPGIVATARHLDLDSLQDTQIDLPLTRTNFKIPVGGILGNQLNPKETAVLWAGATKKDIHTYAEGSHSLGATTEFFTINFLKEDGTPLTVENLEEPFRLFIANSEELVYETNELHIASWNKMFYMNVEVADRMDPSIHIDVNGFSGPDVPVLVVIFKGKSDGIEAGECDDVGFLSTSLGKTTHTTSNTKMNKYNGNVTIGLRQMPAGFDTSTITSCDDLVNVDFESEVTNMTISASTFIGGCYFFNNETKKWDSEGCTVGVGTNSYGMECWCNHLTTFAGGWAVAPNTIDWNFVFSNADFYKNPTIYITEIIIAVVYLLAAIWARRKDKKDVERLGLTPLKDNDPRDKYYYEIVVTTGMRRNAGTDSKVFVILSGEYDETDVRMLNDDKRKVFRRGNTDAFLMSCSEPLGSLNYARVWHDNSGKGKFGSWYMKYMIVRDVQTEEKWIFICNRWFAVEEDDGQVDRVVPVAGLAQMTEFGHLFSERSRKDLVDGHLWFSVIARPPQSRFTRLQRVSCCLCYLFATMLGNAMFYGIVDDQSGTTFTFGPFAVSPQQIYVGIICNLIVFPVNFIVITLFRKSKARKMRPSRLEEALKKMPGGTSASMTDVKPEVAGIWNTGTRPDSRVQSRAETSFSLRPDSSMADRIERRKKKKKKFEFPWWCRILGWIVLWAATFTSAAFVTFYGIMFQDEKCKKWITSMLISFFTSIFVTQPVKVVLTAIFFSLVWRKSASEDDDHPEDEEEPNLATDEEYMHSGESGFGATRPKKIGYKPPDPAVLEKARIQRLNEIKMWDIIREIVFYSFFLWILMVISYRNRSPHGFFYKDTLEKMVIKNNHTLQWFTKIKNTEEFWLWAESGMVNAVRASSYYNKAPPLLLRGYIGDKVSRMMGYATMRQLRVKPALCDPLPEIATVITECNEAYSLFTEDKGSFGPGWQSLGVNETARMEYMYRTASDLNGYPYWGLLEVYGGGGYVFELRGSKEKLKNLVLNLRNETWIDKYTRAIFVEFTVYNPQVNLFAIATILAEFTPSGGVLTSYRFEPAMLLPYMTSVMLFQIVCEVIYLIFTVVFIVKEFRTFLKERTKYFQSFWNLIELSIIAVSLGAVIVYFYRLIITNQLTDFFQRTQGNEYMKFQYAGYWNEMFGYMIGWLVFFGTLKFLKLLRFNKRISLLASTLKNGARSILHFSLMFWILYLAFMQLFYLTFKNVSSAFTTFIMAAESGLLMMMGKFDIYGMLMVEPILTQVYVFSFVVTVTFILVNMFLSILNETFGSVRVDINKQNNDYEIVDFMVNRFKRWTGLGQVKKEEPAGKNAAEQRREPTVEEFPDRIDRLLNSISNVYMDDNIGGILNSNGQSKKMAMKQMLRGPSGSASRVAPSGIRMN